MDRPLYEVHDTAFTVAELGKMLPWEIGGKLLSHSKCNDGSWITFYADNTIGMIIAEYRIDDQGAHTEADARAKMLVYLLENKLIGFTPDADSVHLTPTN